MRERRRPGHVRFAKKRAKDGSWYVEKRTTTSVVYAEGPRKGHFKETSTIVGELGTEDEAAAVVREAKKELARRHLTIAEAIGLYMKSREAAAARINDEEDRAHAVRRNKKVAQYIRSYLSDRLGKPIGSYTSEDAQRRYAVLAGSGADEPWISPETGKPLKGDTIVKWVCDTREFFRWAQDVARLVPEDKANPLARVKVTLPRNVGKDQPSDQERDRIMAYVIAQLSRVEAVVLPGRRTPSVPVDVDSLYVGCLSVTGGRPSELLRRRPNDVSVNPDPDPRLKGTVIITVRKGKTKNAVRQLLVHSSVAPALLRLAAARAEERYLWPFRGETYSVGAVRRVCKNAGVRRFVPYAFRGKSISQQLKEKLDDIARRHGQGGGAVAARHYVNEEVRAQAELALGAEAIGRLDERLKVTHLETVLRKLAGQGLLNPDGASLSLLAQRLVGEFAPAPPPDSPQSSPAPPPSPDAATQSGSEDSAKSDDRGGRFSLLEVD